MWNVVIVWASIGITQRHQEECNIHLPTYPADALWYFNFQIGLNGDSKMDELNFTEDEVREGLAQLGYYNVPTERIKEFKKGNGIFSCMEFI